MTPRTRLKLLTAAAALSLVGLAAANNPVSGEERTTHLGPVGPNEPILATVGNKRLIAFYVPDSGRCSINAVVFDVAPADAPYSSARVRINLWPGESFHLDAAGQKSVDLRCGENAATLALSGPAELINTSATTKAN
ncbi:MAG TPA: hypothetical protein VGY14_00015 [Methyloceanibacter sp.]|jgi:hypothetical protein|nr:hypothetical protein [Methyloceanibacter sp.]